MRHLAWLVQLCLVWHNMKIIETRGEMFSKGNIFPMQKHPAASRDDGNIMKNISKICHDNNDTPDNETAVGTIYDSNRDNSTTKMLNIFQNILQQIQKRAYEQISNWEGNLQSVVQQREEESIKSHYKMQPFSILQQLQLDEQKQKWQQEIQKQKLKLQQQQNALKLQQILQNINGENLGKASKKKKKKKKKKRKRKKPVKDKKKKRKHKNQKPLIAHPAQILFASPTQKPLHFYHQHDDDHYHHPTTEKPFLQHTLLPIKKIEYILRKNTIFKKKKKEYLNHLKHVLYPFIKFIAFFTIINPFTLVIFLFSLISPVVFGFLGFIGLSFFIKPALNLLFGVKHTVNAIKRKKIQQQRKWQRLRDSRRPITIHKHYYQQTPIKPPAPPPHFHYSPLPPLLALKHKRPVPHPLTDGNSHQNTQQMKLFNPLLPGIKQKLKNDKYLLPDMKEYNDSFERF